MQVAKAGRGSLQDVGSAGAASDDAAACASVPAEAWRIAQDIRQDFLNALPIAAALLVEEADGSIAINDSNDRFDRLHQIMRTADAGGGRAAPRLHALAADFFRGTQPAREFDWRDGDTVGGRHFTARLARLRASVAHEKRCLLSLIDRTAEIENERSLRAEMLHDSLTGLPNRTAFAESVDTAIATAQVPLYGQPGGDGVRYAVLVVDLTRFSRINECMGAIAGDEVIITVARRLVSTLRAGDLLARLGGDEFGILLRVRDDAEETRRAAERIAATLATPFRLSELEIDVECAIGIALMGDGHASGEEMIRNAQLALKRAKATGQTELYHVGEAIAARRRFSLETELRRAIERDRLTLAFQPLVDLSSNRISGFEALARWEHEERGAIQPSEFIPVAEESGLIVPLGRWALDTALRTLAGWDAEAGRALPLHVAVNLSALQVSRDDIAGVAAGALQRYGLSGNRLTLELTESAIVQEPERATRVLNALKGLDAKVAMDDFGTGYSSLAYLQRLPIDVLKIDRSFVTGMLADRDKVAIVRAVLSLADALGMTTTAEGVETVELSQTLAALGCSHGQGYYYSEPLPAADALAYWRARSA